MSDQRSQLPQEGNSKSRLNSMLSNLKGKQPSQPLPEVISAEEMDEQSFIQGWHALKVSRKELIETQAELKALHHEYDQFRRDAANQMAAQEKEKAADISHLKANNDFLRQKLEETGREVEHFSRWSYQMEEKCANFERMFAAGLTTIYDAGQHVSVSIMAAINNANATLNDAAQQATNGLTQQIKHVVDDMRGELGRMQDKRGHREYIPDPSKRARQQEDTKPTTQPDEVEKALAELGAVKYGPRQDDEDE
jgi:hypothetical protein